MQKHMAKERAKPKNGTARALGTGHAFKHEQQPEKFTYALAAHSAERRKDGWYVAKSVPSFSNDKVKWSGPFNDVENACLSIARQLFTELADRHTRSIEAHAIKPGDALYGLKPTTRLRAR